MVVGFLWLKSYRSPQLFGEAFSRLATNQKVVALTYDDGPNPPYTHDILDVLNKHHVKATFFVLGKEVEKYPEMTQAIFMNGHEIGNHSWSHEQLIFKSPAFVTEEITKTDRLLRQLGYQDEIHFRAPYGRKLLILPWILSKLNKKHILFDVIPDDWDCTGAEEIVAQVLKQLQPGSIILFHDGGGDRSHTVAATDDLIQKLKAEGYQFLTISEMLKLELPNSKDALSIH